MFDLLFVAVILVFFGLSCLLIAGLERLRGGAA